MLARMTEADYREGTGLSGSQHLQFPLSLTDTNILDTRMAYDLNGRILGKRGGGVSSQDSAEYHYDGDSYRLESVWGKLSSTGNRDASFFYNFQYDATGNLTRDLSKNLEIAYGHDGMPVDFASRGWPALNGNSEMMLHQLYDASGQRVSQVAVPRLARGFPVYWAGEAEGAEDPGMYTVSSLDDALADANYRLNYANYPAPDSVVVFVVPDSGETGVETELSEVESLTKGDTVVPLVLHGVSKYSASYDSLMAKRIGHKAFAQHRVNLDGWVTAEMAESYDDEGAVEESRVVANVYGRGAVIGRVVHSDTGLVRQFFVKNHLGSTVRVVNADGSYATTPTFDYQAYGELQGIREDSLNPVTQKYTGKELDTEVNLYYFGARWYDQELGMWMTPDPAGQFFDPYSYGGNPASFVDDDGRVIVWVNGVGGQDDEDLRETLCSDYKTRCNADDPNDAAIRARNYGYHSPGRARDILLALTPLSAFESGKVYRNIRRAYNMDRDPNSLYYQTGVHVVSHSGGASTSGYATGWFNLTHGYGSVDSRTTVAGWDPLALGRNFSYITGTRTRSYYNAHDPLSYVFAGNDFVFGVDADSKLDVINLDHWCMDGHSNADPNCRSVNDMLKDRVIGYKWGVSKPAEHIGRGVGNGYDEHINPFTYGHNTYTFWRDFDWSEPSSYGDVLLLGHRKAGSVLKDVGCWANPWCD